MPSHSSDSGNNTKSDREWFATTQWALLGSTSQSDSSQAGEAIEKLCRAYWPPLYTYIRRQGYGTEDGQDLTQTFFARLLEKNFWARADPQKGRFRSFLLTALRQFLADERDRARAAKRGGGVALISFDEGTGEEHFLEDLDHNLTHEQQFDRQWASTVLEQARGKLRQECIAAGKSAFYDQVNLLSDESEKSVTYAELAPPLGMSVSAIKSAVSRLRARYGELVREEVAQTVSNPAEVDEEIEYLLSVIGS
jgi:RNA polymerase sigma factor (sigma-70 family)